MELNDFINIKTGKELREYLVNNNIEYTYMRGVYRFETILKGRIVDVLANYKKSLSYSIVFKNENELHANVLSMLELKEELVMRFGIPTIDNTNHLNEEEIFIVYDIDDLSISLVTQPYGTKGEDSFHVATHIAINHKVKIKQNSLNFAIFEVLLYLGGGFLWGLFMFATMGIESGYSKESFAVWMLGGLVFGVVFGLVFHFSTSIGSKHRGNKKINTKKFINYVKGHPVYGDVAFIDKKKNKNVQRIYDAVLDIRDNNCELIVNHRNYVKRIELSLEEIAKTIFYKGVVVKIEEKEYLFFLKHNDQEGINYLRNKINDTLFNNSSYYTFFEMVKDEVIKYNPFSVYDTSPNDCLDDRIMRVCKSMMLDQELRDEKLEEVISYLFDLTPSGTKDLTKIYTDSYNKCFNIEK